MGASSSAPLATGEGAENGIPLFLVQLAGMLRTQQTSASAEMGASATKHGNDLLRMGFSVGQVVHDYGGLCQAITEIAGEENLSIGNDEFKTLNACLDDAIASAVSEFGRQREQSVADQGLESLGLLAHELRNALESAMFAFEAIRVGAVGVGGSTGAILARSLSRMGELITRSLAEVRLNAGKQQRKHLSVAALVEELKATAALEAQRRGLHLTVGPIEAGLAIHADTHLVVSALTNLLQNAFKFTQPHTRVTLRTIATADRVRIEIEDECGGLPIGKIDDLFRMFSPSDDARSGLGLGLGICRRAVEANDGTVDVRDLPGKGCIFSVDLPRHERPRE
jgi:signal transduction histidine kinase